MGYDLHVHRRTDWFEDGTDITLNEWREMIAGDASLRVDGSVSWASLEDGSSIETPTVEWTATDGSKGYFYWNAGMIESKNPSEQAIGKLRAIAEKMGGRVQGDDGEFY